jgi:NADH:ubiquinone oxidoreductase subunit 5 (subunit L)/multisubunit Na+/H+ antiporter MnhA subunit
MIVGSVTILFAVMMALIQKDYKRLLAYHAISQVGYMILGIGTALPVGIVGGLFHMVNNAIYKCGLFMTAGAVEKQAGTSDLHKLGGLGKYMPVTFACFVITALSISGVPPFNGFFSKELVYDAALERGVVFYFMAVAGSFFTAASFLKLGHAAFLGPAHEEHKNVKEAPVTMLLPMIAMAALCVFFGVKNQIPVDGVFVPLLGHLDEAGHHFSGMPANVRLVLISVVVLLAAVMNHMFGVRMHGAGIKAVDHIHHMPFLYKIYKRAEKRVFDPYEHGMRAVGVFSAVAFAVDRAIDWVYNVGCWLAATRLVRTFRKMNTGDYTTYIIWSLAGLSLVIIFLYTSM